MSFGSFVFIQVNNFLYVSLVLWQVFEAWVNDTAEHGFVVVSFGAGVKYLSQDITQKLAGALARLPQRVVWR